MEKDSPFEETSVEQLENIFSTILNSKIQVELDEENVEKKLFLHFSSKCYHFFLI